MTTSTVNLLVVMLVVIVTANAVSENGRESQVLKGDQEKVSVLLKDLFWPGTTQGGLDAKTQKL